MSASLESGEAIAWHQRELLLIREASRLMGRTASTPVMVRQTLRLLSEWVGLNRGRVLLWEAQDECLRIRHAYGLTPEDIARGRFASAEGVCGAVFKQGAPRVIQDIDAEPEFLCRSVPRDRLPPETVSFLCVPLRDGDRVMGVLAAHRLRQRPRALDADLELLQTVGAMLGQAIRLEIELRRRTAQLESENRDLRDRLLTQLPNHGIIGDSPVLKASLEQARRFAASDVTVLIQGESGTGKELFARALHEASDRCSGPFVKVNCAAVPESLFESEFFGHERGAFTGAVSAQPGRFEQAEGGTLFLDEAGELPLALQAKLLRVLQERVVVRVGGRKELKLDVRIVAATNRDLAEAVSSGSFRLDLYYRLSVMPLRLAPLRERPQDVPLLVQHYAHEACLAWRRDPIRLSEPAMRLMQAHPWPGNVRQLQSVVLRLVMMASAGLIDAASVSAQLLAEPDPLATTSSGAMPDARARLPDAAPSGLPDAGRVDAWPAGLVRPYVCVAPEDSERVREALARSGGNRSRAAQLLGMTRRQFTYRMEKLGLAHAVEPVWRQTL